MFKIGTRVRLIGFGLRGKVLSYCPVTKGCRVETCERYDLRGGHRFGSRREGFAVTWRVVLKERSMPLPDWFCSDTEADQITEGLGTEALQELFDEDPVSFLLAFVPGGSLRDLVRFEQISEEVSNG